MIFRNFKNGFKNIFVAKKYTGELFWVRLASLQQKIPTGTKKKHKNLIPDIDEIWSSPKSRKSAKIYDFPKFRVEAWLWSWSSVGRWDIWCNHLNAGVFKKLLSTLVAFLSFKLHFWILTFFMNFWNLFDNPYYRLSRFCWSPLNFHSISTETL